MFNPQCKIASVWITNHSSHITFIVDEYWMVSGEGGNCGGIAGIQCKDDLECKYEESFPDAMGICSKKGKVKGINKST